MVQIPLLSGITASERADFNLSYPVNLEPVPTESGISKGYVRSAMGASTFGTGPGVDRGGIVWNGVHYRVMGTKLVSVSSAGAATTLGDVGSSGLVTLDYGPDLLGIRSGTSLYFWNGLTLAQVTDPDLGPCIDIAWFNGQWFSTDGSYIVALDIADPFSVNPLKYGAAETDPDPITGFIKIRDELLVMGGNTIQPFNYVGGSGFPLQANTGGTIPIGCSGALAKCLFAQSVAFVGSGKGQATGAWIVQSGTARKLSTRVIDDYLAAEPNLAAIQLETRVSRDEERLYVHLSDKTLVFLQTATGVAQSPVWYVAKSGRAMDSAYRMRSAVLVGGQFICGDTESSALGLLREDLATHFGEGVGWQFDTLLLYNKALAAIIHTLELIGLMGRGGGTGSIFLSFTVDGETWTQERANLIGALGARGKRMQWRPHKRFHNYLGIRFRGSSDQLAGFAALEAEIEGLNA